MVDQFDMAVQPTVAASPKQTFRQRAESTDVDKPATRERRRSVRGLKKTRA
jgi:hypothetical protein